MPDSIRQQLAWASAELAAISSNARLDSEVLLAHCLRRPRSYLFAWPERALSDTEQDCFRDLVRRRLKPEPVAYLVGEREFYSLPIKTTDATLVPRPETEMLVDKVLELVGDLAHARVLDLGTGSGAIALAIKRHAPACTVTATDISPAALVVARANAIRLALEVNFVACDWFQGMDSRHGYDVIVSNPPYVAEADPCLSQGDLPAEPRSALCSGASGLDALQEIIGDAGRFLRPGGWLVLEHGYDQRSAVQGLLHQCGFTAIEAHTDLSQQPRMSTARWMGVRSVE